MTPVADQTFSFVVLGWLRRVCTSRIGSRTSSSQQHTHTHAHSVLCSWLSWPHFLVFLCVCFSLSSFRKAETRFGLQIVRIPTNQPLRSGDSFHVPVPMHIHNPYIMRLVEEYLILECGFVIDSELHGSKHKRQRAEDESRRVDLDTRAHRSEAILTFCFLHPLFSPLPPPQWLSSVCSR